jgi:hypothetical protein
VLSYLQDFPTCVCTQKVILQNVKEIICYSQMLCFGISEVTFSNIYDKFIMILQDVMQDNYRKFMSINAYFRNQVAEGNVTFPNVICRKLRYSFRCLITYVCASYLIKSTATNAIEYVCVCLCVCVCVESGTAEGANNIDWY